jgi:hypothetical protein
MVKDANGDKVETSPVRARFDDKRYSWQSLTSGKVNIYWYEGDKAFAGEIMSASQQALAKLAADTGAYLGKPIRGIYAMLTLRICRGH